MSKRFIVAVSGGVDSVVLLNMITRIKEYELIVAHFDHGIRPESADDARFVAALAKKYKLSYEEGHAVLGPQASEGLAREKRYRFLRQVAKKHHAKIMTAHHSDDIVETIAINLRRGTGWRGLAVLGAADVERPLVTWTKRAIYTYALEHRLEWVEDSTNRSDTYLRNRLRARIYQRLTSEAQDQLLKLWRSQMTLKHMIDGEAAAILPESRELQRYLFIMVDEGVAGELLRQYIEHETTKRLTFPQLERGVLAIKTSPPGATIQLGEGVVLKFSKTTFVASRGEKML